MKILVCLIFFGLEFTCKSLTIKKCPYGPNIVSEQEMCNLRVRCYQNAISQGYWEWTPFGRETISGVQFAAKNTMNSLLTVHGRHLACKGKAINLLKSHQKRQHTRESCESHKHASCQFCAAGRRGRAQVCSSAYCSLAWVNKEKTGAIRRTCQAWNSLLMFTPFTLGLSQRCCLSPDFWQGPTAICFFSESEQTISVVCHTRHTTHMAGRGKFAEGQVLKKLCMLKWH